MQPVSNSRQWPKRCLTEIKVLYNGLEEHGRKGMLRRAREQRRAAMKAKGTATA